MADASAEGADRTAPEGGDDDATRSDPDGAGADGADADGADPGGADLVGVDPDGADLAAADADGPAGSVQLIPMRRRHLRAVLKIEGQVYPRPWTLTLYMSELNLRTSRHYVVARLGGGVVGYAGLLFTADEAHITTIAVDPLWHRRQIGTRLMLHQAAVARRRRARHLTLEVRITNAPAQEMYRRFGFAPEGIRKNYYSEIHEDAVVMWARNIDTDEYQQRLDRLAADLPSATRDEAMGA